jgi:AcrR family transcriptional regulator
MEDKVRKKKRIRNPEQTREKLLKATVDLVAEKGIEALSMKEVAQKAEVSRSVAYLHFADRDDLLKAAKEWISARLQDGVKRFDENTTLFERVLYTTQLVLKNHEASRIMITDALSGGGLDLHDPLFQSVKERLTLLQSQGGLKPDFDLEILTYIHLGGSIASTLLLREHCKDQDMDELAERFARDWSRVLQGGMFNLPPA